MYNNKIIELEKTIIEAINNSQLHVGTVALVLDKINTTVKNAFTQEVANELEKTAEQDFVVNSDLVKIDND